MATINRISGKFPSFRHWRRGTFFVLAEEKGLYDRDIEVNFE